MFVGALFLYCDVFVIMPCDHVRKFPSFIVGDAVRIFAYIRDVVVRFFLLLHVLLLAQKIFTHDY